MAVNKPQPGQYHAPEVVGEYAYLDDLHLQSSLEVITRDIRRDRAPEFSPASSACAPRYYVFSGGGRIDGDRRRHQMHRPRVSPTRASVDALPAHAADRPSRVLARRRQEGAASFPRDIGCRSEPERIADASYGISAWQVGGSEAKATAAAAKPKERSESTTTNKASVMEVPYYELILN